MSPRFRFLGGAAAAMLLLLTPMSALAASPPASLEPLIRRTMAAGLTPGLSVGVVRGNQMIWAAGFGEADREAHRPVTPETRFYIASTSKALTALAAARRAAHGELDLDAPLNRLLPGAQFGPGVSGDSITFRNLLTHTHGIHRIGPVSLRVAFTGEYTNADLLAALAAHPAAPGGRGFSYSNLGYDLAGIVLAPAVTRGWKEVVEREVLAPLGMTATTADASRVPPRHLALPYETGASGVERTPLRKRDENMGPAGGHFSTAPDLARLLLAELNGGQVDGRAAIESAVIEETQRLQVSQDRAFPPFQRHGWGLGWDLGTYDGDTLIHRFGSFQGYRSHVSFMPGRRLGVVVLLNGGQAAAGLADALAAAIYDRLLERADAESKLASRIETIVQAAGRAREAIVADLAKRAARPQTLPRPLSAYAGTYVHPLYGTLRIGHEAGKLVTTMGALTSPMEVFDREKEAFRVELIGDAWVITARFDSGAAEASALRLLDVDFVRSR